MIAKLTTTCIVLGWTAIVFLSISGANANKDILRAYLCFMPMWGVALVLRSRSFRFYSMLMMMLSAGCLLWGYDLLYVSLAFGGIYAATVKILAEDIGMFNGREGGALIISAGIICACCGPSTINRAEITHMFNRMLTVTLLVAGVFVFFSATFPLFTKGSVRIEG